jgi:hypothetical protein
MYVAISSESAELSDQRRAMHRITRTIKESTSTRTIVTIPKSAAVPSPPGVVSAGSAGKYVTREEGLNRNAEGNSEADVDENRDRDEEIDREAEREEARDRAWE